MDFYGLDELDSKILSLLQENARLTYSQIGEAVGLSRVAVKNRIKALEQKDIIRGYHAQINPVAAPGTMPFYFFIETKPEMYDSVSQRLKDEPVVSCLFQISGNNAMLGVCNAQSKEDRAGFAWRVRNSYEGVTYFSFKDIWQVVKGSILPD